MSYFNIVKSEFFDDLKCDVYQGEEEYYMTREQIGNALGYANPRVAISNIHARNRDRFDGMSVVLKLSTTDGKSYDTVVYSRKGIMEICRWSRQPKADAFID
jgi:prophage antirepressor-like protein